MNKHLRQWVLVLVLIESWALVSALAPATPLKTFLSIIFLLYIPGKLLSRLVIGERPLWNRWADLTSSVGLSLILLMGIGLSLSVGLPPLGISKPLTAMPLTIAIASVCTLLLFGIMARRQLIFTAHQKLFRPTVDKTLFAIIATCIPILATLGAISLNNRGTAIFSQLMLALVICVALVLVWKQRASHSFTLPLGLYMISLGLLLSSSLRGWHITGHDVIQEYQVFQLTATNGVWNMAFLRDAYNACLSITVLPTILSKLTSLNDLYIYKFLFQAIFALMPVVMYTTIARFAAPRIAFLSSLLFITFPTFMVDMPMLGRQEIAFFMFALAFMCVFNEQLTKRPRTVLTLLFLAGMVVSHYSTAYISIGVLIAAKSVELVFNLSRRLLHKPQSLKPWMPLSWATVIIIGLFAYFWNAQVTGTSQSISKTIVGVVTNAPQLVAQALNPAQRSLSVVAGASSPEQLFEQYTSTIRSTGRDLPASQYYPDSLTRFYPLQLRTETFAPLTSLGHFLADRGISLPAFYEFVRGSYAKIIQGLIVIALVVFTFLPRTRQLPRQYLLIGLGFFAMIVVQVLAPPQLIDYGILRLLHQSLIFLALPIILLSIKLFSWVKLPELWRPRLVALGLLAFFFPLSGLLPSITGGYKPTLATSNAGFYYESYYTHDDELAGYRWLKRNAPYGAVANADEFARRKMITYINIYARPTMTADTIAKDSYVYLSHSNTETGKMGVFALGDPFYQSLPTPFLEANKDQLYSGGKVQIYH